jgi:hypothetical protein
MVLLSLSGLDLLLMLIVDLGCVLTATLIGSML